MAKRIKKNNVSFIGQSTLEDLINPLSLGVEVTPLTPGQIFKQSKGSIIVLGAVEINWDEHIQSGHVCQDQLYAGLVTVVTKAHYVPKKATAEIANEIKKKLKSFIKNNSIIKFGYVRGSLHELPCGQYDGSGAIDTYVIFKMAPILSDVPDHDNIEVAELCTNGKKDRTIRISVVHPDTGDLKNRKIVAVLPPGNLCPCSWCARLIENINSNRIY